MSRSRLRLADLLPLASVGLRTRRLRAGLSALGIIAVGIASLVGVLGITASSQASLLAEIDRLGTNLLTVTNGRDLQGSEVPLPATAPGALSRLDGVTAVAPTAELRGVHAYRHDRVPAVQTGSLSVRAADDALLAALDAVLAAGGFLTRATSRYPLAVLGSEAAERLGGVHRIWVGGHWLTVAGVLQPLALSPEIDRSVLIGFSAATRLYGYDGHPSRIYLRAVTDQVEAVAGKLARTASPADPAGVDASRPSDALTARLSVARAGTGLFLGLGGVALLVSAIGIANVMVIGVLERRAEIGLRRALGATHGHVAAQFLAESLLASALGGVAGVLLGAVLTVALAWAAALGRADPPSRRLCRLRDEPGHRRPRRPLPGHARRPPGTHRGAADHVGQPPPAGPAGSTTKAPQCACSLEQDTRKAGPRRRVAVAC
jgi:putative ABC transport system permease protein